MLTTTRVRSTSVRRASACSGRMALLLTLSKLPFERAGHQDIGHEPGVRCSNHKCITRTELYVPLHGKIGDRCPYCDKLLELDI